MMSDIYLTHSEALEAYELYWSGEKVRSIHSKYDVDPRRLYEILDGETHQQARQEFLEKLQVSRPKLAARLSSQQRWRRGKTMDASQKKFEF